MSRATRPALTGRSGGQPQRQSLITLLAGARDQRGDAAPISKAAWDDVIAETKRQQFWTHRVVSDSFHTDTGMRATNKLRNAKRK